MTMFKTTRKPRAPIAQLIEAGDIARNMSIAKGLVSSKSIFDKLSEMPNAPILPGYPPYLPDKWTLDASRNVVFDIVKKWVSFNNGDSDRQEKFEPFCRFAERRLAELERVYRAKTREDMLNLNTDDPIAKIFSNQKILSTSMGMRIFITATFVISNIVKTNSSVSDYLTWFLEDYTPKLNELWKKDRAGQDKP